jgi:hypothetical protein
MAEETETSATVSSGGNWWNAVSTGSSSSLVSEWSNINILQPSPCASAALTDIQTLNWSSSSNHHIRNSGNGEDVDNLSSSITNNTSSSLTSMDSGHQELVDSGSLLGQFAHAVPDNNTLWNQMLLGSSEGMQSSSVANLNEVLYSRALRQELVEPSDQLKKIQQEVPLQGWEFRNMASFQGEDIHLNPQQQAPLLYNLDDRLQSSNAHALPDLGRWSVAPPKQPGHSLPRNISLNAAYSNTPQFDLSRIKQEYPGPYTSPDLGVSLSSNTQLLQGFGIHAEPNFKNEGFCHILESATTKAFLKPTMAARGCHITGDDYPGRWLPNSSLSQMLPSSPSKQSVLNFGSMSKQVLDFSACKPDHLKAQQVSKTDCNLQYFPEGKQIHGPAQHRTMPHGEEARDSSSDTKRNNSCTDQSTAEAIFKRPRLDTGSTLPTFKVRKEKLGDRITALQQLVSPFGKTDTASVLLEAIGYIKFLQDQVQVLSTPYLKSGGTSNPGSQDHKGWGSSDKKDLDEPKQDLRSRGLCLVPVSCTLHVANDNGADYWTPSLGGTYR